MSHFTVMVIGPEIEKQLQPFHEVEWDWWQVGGRWTGFFKLKSGCSGEVGSPGLMTKSAKPGYADMARKGDIDIETMRDDAGNEAAEMWDKVHIIIGDKLDGFIPWKQMREEEHLCNIEAVRKAYGEQPAVKAFRDNKEFGFFDSIENYIIPREQYIQNARNSAITPFAVLREGQWYEKGNMGWWGVATNEKAQGDWNEEFSTLIDGLPDDTLLTVVDCHI